MEIWKEIMSYPDYKISNKGRVLSYKRNKEGKILKGGLAGNGYLTVILCDGVSNKRFYNHRLVGDHFIDNELKKPQINHKNGDKLNNTVENLEWCTAKENLKHARFNGLNNLKGQLANNSKLNDEDVLSIKKIYKKGFLSQKSIAKKYNVSQANISKIINNKSFNYE